MKHDDEIKLIEPGPELEGNKLLREYCDWIHAAIVAALCGRKIDPIGKEKKDD